MLRARIALGAVAGAAIVAAAGRCAPAFGRATVVAQVSPGPAETATPSSPPIAQPTPTFKFIYRPTPAPVATPFPQPGVPQILEVDLTDQYLVTPGRLDVRVFTSTDVQTVNASTMGYTVPIPKYGPGQFGGSANVGSVPWFLKNKLFPIDVVATGSTGQTADVTLQLGLK